MSHLLLSSKLLPADTCYFLEIKRIMRFFERTEIKIFVVLGVRITRSFPIQLVDTRYK